MSGNPGFPLEPAWGHLVGAWGHLVGTWWAPGFASLYVPLLRLWCVTFQSRKGYFQIHFKTRCSPPILEGVFGSPCFIRILFVSGILGSIWKHIIDLLHFLVLFIYEKYINIHVCHL